jgi:hypothetical protein
VSLASDERLFLFSVLRLLLKISPRSHAGTLHRILIDLHLVAQVLNHAVKVVCMVKDAQHPR